MVENVWYSKEYKCTDAEHECRVFDIEQRMLCCGIE